MSFRECPFCGEEIKRDAIKCRFCREWIKAPRAKSQEDIFDKDNLSDDFNTSFELAPELLTDITDDTTTISSYDRKRNRNQNRIKKRTNSSMRQAQEIATPAESKPIIIPGIEMLSQHTFDIPESGWLLRQNFGRGKKVSLFLSILSALLFIILAVSLISGERFSTPPDLPIAFLFILTIIGSGSLFNLLNTYLQNFKISPQFITYVYAVQISISLSIATFFLSGAEGIATLFSKTLQCTGWLFLIIGYITFILAGKCIYDIRDNDHVGGCNILGNIMFKGGIFPVVWFAIPFITYKIFSRAQNYEKKFTQVIFTKKEKINSNKAEDIVLER
ncbi:MAG: hypothetical protein E6772_07630 [Dysgonomonas sp.]|nr:hypothetical protein [Dysgonomonas sp.]